jgi:DNA replicative helicase MCM subunit Mcm2 (Cdc46/Mcm family)
VLLQVQAYKELRTEDAVPGTTSAYRITVRQLEALVRLSEAMARAHCSATITTRHVEDAKRLLRSSILRIEQRDVELDQVCEKGAGRALLEQAGSRARTESCCCCCC